MSRIVSNNDSCFETSTLSSTGLFLDRFYFQNLVFQSWSNKVLDDFVFLDGKRKGVNFSEIFDLVGFDKTAKFGNWHPFFLFVATSTASSATTTSAESSAVIRFCRWCFIRHD